MTHRGRAGEPPGATPLDTHETMLDPECNVAEQLANALKHHRKNPIEEDKTQRNVEVLRQLVTRLETLTDPSNQDD